MTWNQRFQNANNFQHPNLTSRNGKIPEPSLFEHFPESEDVIKRFVDGNLANLTMEFLQDFVITGEIVKGRRRSS